MIQLCSDFGEANGLVLKHALLVFFFITLQPRVEWYTSLWALNTSPARNHFTFLRSCCSYIKNTHLFSWLCPETHTHVRYVSVMYRREITLQASRLSFFFVCISEYTRWYMTLGRCPSSIFCSRGTPLTLIACPGGPKGQAVDPPQEGVPHTSNPNPQPPNTNPQTLNLEPTQEGFPTPKTPEGSKKESTKL